MIKIKTPVIKRFFSTAAFFLFLMLTATTLAQPGGGHGDRPMGPPPGGFRDGGRPSSSDREHMRKQWEAMRAQEKAQDVRQKKSVREGDVFKVVGTLQDSTNNEPIPYVNLAILDAADSSMVKGGITDLNGYFELTNIPQGDMLLRVSAIGYQNILYPFSVTNNTALGIVKMAPGATTLKEVKITASRPLYAMDGEKLVYNVAEDPTIQTGTTSDALQNAPGVEVDVEGNVSLRGVSSVEIWVNDKPSKLTEENLKTYLETLPANALDRIETITNPSAKYATSAEAVINIITSAYIKSNHFISFGINGATQPNVSPWLSYTWANEKLSINLYASGRYNYSHSDGWSKTTYRKDHNAAPDGTYDTTSYESYDNDNTSRRLNGNIFANINYSIDSMTDIEFMAHYNYSSNPSISTLMRERTEYVPSLMRYQYVDTNDNSGRNGFGRFGVDYTHKFDDNGHNIRASISDNISHGTSENDFIRLYTINTDGRGQNYDKAYCDNYRTNNFDADVRYNRPYSENGEFSFGLGYGLKRTVRDYNVFDNFTISPIDDLLRSYDFDDTENSVEADVEWTRRWGGFTLELGFGSQYENVDFCYQGLTGAPQFTNDDTVCNYITFNPSIHLSYRTESMHNFKLNYSMRMRRPDENDITTYKRYSLDGWSSGRREVTYAYTHSAEAGWNKYFITFGNIGIEGYGRFSTNEVSSLNSSTDVADSILDRIVQFSQPYNMGSSYRVGGTVFLTIRPSGFFNIRLYSNIYDYGYQFEHPETHVVMENHRVSWSTRLNCWVKLWNKYQVFASANYSSPTISLAAERKARYSLNCGVRADFFKRKLSAFVNVQDIFNWGKTVGSGGTNTNPYLLSENNNYTLNSRYISAGITLRFGKMELENRTKTGADEE